jgi:hypothetical protein
MLHPANETVSVNVTYIPDPCQPLWPLYLSILYFYSTELIVETAAELKGDFNVLDATYAPRVLSIAIGLLF